MHPQINGERNKVHVALDALVSPLRVLVVEDYEPFLQHVSSTLRQHSSLEVVGETQNGIEAVEFAAALQPDLIFLDIGLPGLNGIAAAYRIRALAPNARIVFLTQESSSEILQEALNLGAWGYVIKAKAARDLPRAIEGVLRGTKFVSEGLDEALA